MCSKPLEGYTQNTQNVATLKQAHDQDVNFYQGQEVGHIVINDNKNSREQVALANVENESYDEAQLIRAVESVLSPLG